jgi:hypothetical protein
LTRLGGRRTVLEQFEDFYWRKCVSTFKADRDLIVGLTDKDAHEVLAVLDAGDSREEVPVEFRAALEAAGRSPDVSRYFLVQKAQEHVARQLRLGVRVSSVAPGVRVRRV